MTLMKKILITVWMAVLFSMAAIAQQQGASKPTQNQSVESDSAVNKPGETLQQQDTTGSTMYQRTQPGTYQDNTADESGNNEEGNGQSSASNEVDIHESKEGPNNEVVYKYQGELYYVDREKHEFVKANESQLRDSGHKVIVKDPGASQTENARNTGRTRTKG